MIQQLNEQKIVTDFIRKVFDAILSDRNRALERAMEKDPTFQKIIADVEKSKNELHQWVEARVKKDPKLAQKLAAVRNL